MAPEQTVSDPPQSAGVARVFIVSIDIKDGVYDIIHVFSNREAAETYMAWQEARGGDHCYVTEAAVEDGWIPHSTTSAIKPASPPLFSRTRFLHGHESWMGADSHRHVHWDDIADDWRRCEARHP